MKRMAASVVVALSVIAGGAQAATVTYNFTVKDFYNPTAPDLVGVFTYDDANTATIAPVIDGFTSYQALSMSLSGVLGTNPVLGINNNLIVDQTMDAAIFQATFNTTQYTLLMLFPGATFGGVSADQMNGRAFADLGTFNGLFSSVGLVDSVTTPTSFNALLALSQGSSSIPIPATIALLGLGLIGIGSVVRKQA